MTPIETLQAMRAWAADHRQRGEFVAAQACESCASIAEVAIAQMQAAEKVQSAPVEPICQQCGDQIMAHDPGICGCCLATGPRTATPLPDLYALAVKKYGDSGLYAPHREGFVEGARAAVASGAQGAVVRAAQAQLDAYDAITVNRGIEWPGDAVKAHEASEAALRDALKGTP